MRILVTALVASSIVFVWGLISWKALPWHQQVLLPFQDTESMGDIVDTIAEKNGMYVYPYIEESDQQLDTLKSPFIFTSICKNGKRFYMKQQMLISFGIQFLLAFVLVMLLKISQIKSFNQKYLFVFIWAIGLAIVSTLPNWNWWGYSNSYTLVSILDLLVGWLLSGLWVSWHLRT